MTELCERYGGSRQTGYAWVDHSLTHGPQGVEERSRRPDTSPRHTLTMWWRRSLKHDNGVTFATNTLARLSLLSSWWGAWAFYLSSSNRVNRNRTAATNGGLAP